MLDNARWNRLVSQLCTGCMDGCWFDHLVAAYGQAHRHYHGQDHVMHCLNELDQAMGIAGNPLQVEFAIWLHDAVYDPHISDNEEKSADLAVRMLSSMGADATATLRIKELILDTRHDREPKTRDGRLLVDIDLSSLGQPPAVYDQYEIAIRAEHAWVPADVYVQARRRILSGFTGRPRIYYTDLFFGRYEQAARQNIQRTLEKL